MHHLTEEQKWNIVQQFKRTQNISKVARQCNCNVKSARRWIQRYAATRSVCALRKSGRTPAFSKGAAKKALQLLTDGEQCTADGVARQLKANGTVSTVVHKTTVLRHARAAAKNAGQQFRITRGKPKKALTADTMAKRLAFAIANKNTDWRRVLFTDRKKFLFRWPGSKVAAVRYELVGGKSTKQTGAYQPSHPQALNVYAGISMYGTTQVHVVAGTSKHQHAHTNKKGQAARNITSGEYRDVLMATLLPGGQHLFGVPGLSSWVLQQDGDQTHRVAQAVLDHWNRNHASTVQLLPNWPPNSPDLNPIENVWAHVQRVVDGKGCPTFDAYSKAVKHELTHLPKHILVNLIKSMPRRIAQVISTGGNKTKY